MHQRTAQTLPLAALLLALGFSLPTSAQAAAVTRVQAVHELVGLTLDWSPGFAAAAPLADVLARHHASATVFVTAEDAVRAAAPLRTLAGSGAEIGLACRGSCRDPGREAATLQQVLGERPSLFRPPAGDTRSVASAYQAGLVSVLWSRRLPSDARLLAQALAGVHRGELLDFTLRDRISVDVLARALDLLSERRLLAVHASGLLQDTAQHLELCSAFARETFSPSADLSELFPEAGPVPRALWHLGSFGRMAARRLYGVRPHVRIAGRDAGGLFPAEVHALLADLARQYARAPVNATIDRETGSVVPDRPGQALDVAATRRSLEAAEAGQEVLPVLRSVPARWRAQDLRALRVELGHYRTWISGSSGRYANIVKGASLLDRRLLFPGETFSTLAAIGRPTRARGWHVAPVILYGAFGEGVGGGLCQVSSTLYNAVARAGLTIVERHHHARAVHYVPRGKDATIAWPDLDFRFRNDRATPVLLRAWVRRGALHMAIYGTAEPARGLVEGGAAPRSTPTPRGADL